MIESKKYLGVALIFPIVALALTASYKKFLLSQGLDVILPITAYDPRDLLSGHYLTYRIEYGVSGICYRDYEYQGHICLERKEFTEARPDDCKQLISGMCRDRRFEAGIERFYIPEEKAAFLEKRIQQKTASIVLSVNVGGRAQVKDLLIDGKSWKDLIEE